MTVKETDLSCLNSVKSLKSVEVVPETNFGNRKELGLMHWESHHTGKTKAGLYRGPEKHASVRR